MYDFTKQNAQKLGRLNKKVEELEKRIKDLERNSGSAREILTLSKRGPGRPKKTDVA